MSCDNLDITGGVKFFENNSALFRKGSRANASSSDESAKFIIDISKYTRWESVNSDDNIEETITINLYETIEVNRLFIVGHNFKEFDIKYNSDLDFTNVEGVNGLLSSINETFFDQNTSYYKFDSVMASSITIRIRKTQVPNENKYLTSFISTIEIGTLIGFPRVQNVLHNRNLKAEKVLSGKNVVQKGYEVTSFRLGFSSYPVAQDVKLVDGLHDREESFLVWLCGGRYGEEHFKIEQRGWRLEDVYNMQISAPLAANYEKGIYNNGANLTASFVEVI